ncbi:MAG TPA: hypothetical protein VIQ76_12055, partial [Propionibacteriaceae bacterium]
MPRSLFRVAPSTLLVGDTGALMNDIVQGTRNGRLTSLNVAMEKDTFRLFISQHVLIEVERDLPRHAARGGVDVELAVRRWRHYYLPFIRIVKVPEMWGATHPNVGEVARRHSSDLATAQLAAALAPCCVLAEDSDLTDYGFGMHEWLP